MNKLSYIFTIFIICLFSYKATAQDSELDSLDIAEAYLESENFNNAIRFYRQFLMQMPDDPELNFKMGFSLLNTSDGKEESIEYFEKSTKIYRKKEGKKRIYSLNEKTTKPLLKIAEIHVKSFCKSGVCNKK